MTFLTTFTHGSLYTCPCEYIVVHLLFMTFISYTTMCIFPIHLVSYKHITLWYLDTFIHLSTMNMVHLFRVFVTTRFLRSLSSYVYHNKVKIFQFWLLIQLWLYYFTNIIHLYFDYLHSKPLCLYTLLWYLLHSFIKFWVLSPMRSPYSS